MGGIDQRQRILSRRFPMVLRFQSLEVERTRKMKEIGGFFLYLFFINIMYSLIKVQETVWSTSYDRNKTCKQSNDRFTPSWEKSNPSSPEPTLPPNST